MPSLADFYGNWVLKDDDLGEISETPGYFRGNFGLLVCNNTVIGIFDAKLCVKIWPRVQ